MTLWNDGYYEEDYFEDMALDSHLDDFPDEFFDSEEAYSNPISKVTLNAQPLSEDSFEDYTGEEDDEIEQDEPCGFSLNGKPIFEDDF